MNYKKLLAFMILIFILICYKRENYSMEDLVDMVKILKKPRLKMITNIDKSIKAHYKICFYSYDDRYDFNDKDSYIYQHILNFSKYVSLHKNYTFIFDTGDNDSKISLDNIPPWWKKIFLMKKLMITHPGYDYYIWVDSDVVIGDITKSIASFIDSNPRYDIYCVQAYLGFINAGIIIFDAFSPLSMKILNNSIEYYYKHKDVCMIDNNPKKLRGHMGLHCYEQMPLNYFARDYPDQVAILGGNIAPNVCRRKRIDL